jgi:peptidoglycan-associated lipoprotein
MKNAVTKLPLISALAVTFLLAGCSKKVAKVTPPPLPPPPTPTATLAASPEVIHPGQSSVLTWHTENANAVTIQGVGAVSATGTRTVSPTNSTSYTLIAQGPGGMKDASVRVTVKALPAPAAATPGPSEADLFAKNVKDVFFDFDKSNIRPDEVAAASGDASFLEQHSSIRVMIEGHCDDRGSEEYNIALGQSRAQALKENLQRSGVDSARIQTISYGKERPFCTMDNEACWQENRRDHIVPQQ